MTGVPVTIDAGWLETEAAEKIRIATGEVILDLCSVPRLDARAVAALEQLAELAGSRRVSVVLRGVNGDVYKVLKLLKLAGRFSFLN